uniref:Putative secreted protein n=1 Tax=Anopheles darlingi TaxID=43151 RepID=A0A2M4DLU8_ANODA
MLHKFQAITFLILVTCTPITVTRTHSLSFSLSVVLFLENCSPIQLPHKDVSLSGANQTDRTLLCCLPCQGYERNTNTHTFTHTQAGAHRAAC